MSGLASKSVMRAFGSRYERTTLVRPLPEQTSRMATPSPSALTPLLALPLPPPTGRPSARRTVTTCAAAPYASDTSFAQWRIASSGRSRSSARTSRRKGSPRKRDTWALCAACFERRCSRTVSGTLHRCAADSDDAGSSSATGGDEEDAPAAAAPVAASADVALERLCCAVIISPSSCRPWRPSLL